MATSPMRGDENVSEPRPETGYGHGHAESDVAPAGPTHDLPYEPDQFAVKTILTVPIAVIGTAFGAFVITWIVFATIFDPRKYNPEPTMAAGAKENAAPLNERFGRISSSDPKAEVQQPRLEGLQKTQVYYKDGNPENKNPSNMVVSEYITTQPTREGNSPRFHIDDLRPDRVKELNSYGVVDKQTGQARMPVGKAMEVAVGSGLLPAQPGARPLDIEPNPDRPKESNAGRGRSPEPTLSAKKSPEDKKEPEKKGPNAAKK